MPRWPVTESSSCPYSAKRGRVQSRLQHFLLLLCLTCAANSRTLDGQGATAHCQDLLSRRGKTNSLIFSDGARVVSWRNRKDGAVSPSCFVYSDKKFAGAPLLGHPNQVVGCSVGDLDAVISWCHELMMRNITDLQSLSRHGRSLTIIFPGTLWCGPGNATNGDPNKLGRYAATDSCCRAHDHCTPYINPGTRDPARGLYNDALLSVRFHCDCDRTFKTCLKQSNDPVAPFIGSLFFNFFSAKCFDLLPDCGKTRSTTQGCSSNRLSWRFVSSGDY